MAFPTSRPGWLLPSLAAVAVLALIVALLSRVLTQSQTLQVGIAVELPAPETATCQSDRTRGAVTFSDNYGSSPPTDYSDEGQVHPLNVHTTIPAGGYQNALVITNPTTANAGTLAQLADEYSQAGDAVAASAKLFTDTRKSGDTPPYSHCTYLIVVSVLQSDFSAIFARPLPSPPACPLNGPSLPTSPNGSPIPVLCIPLPPRWQSTPPPAAATASEQFSFYTEADEILASSERLLAARF